MTCGCPIKLALHPCMLQPVSYKHRSHHCMLTQLCKKRQPCVRAARSHELIATLCACAHFNGTTVVPHTYYLRHTGSDEKSDSPACIPNIACHGNHFPTPALQGGGPPVGAALRPAGGGLLSGALLGCNDGAAFPECCADGLAGPLLLRSLHAHDYHK